MLKRLLTGTCYILVLAVCYCLKIFVPQPFGDFCFDALIYAFALIGTFEMLRAVKNKITKAEKALVWAFAIVAIPACALCCVYFKGYSEVAGGIIGAAAAFMAFTMALFIAFIANHEKMTLESLGVSFGWRWRW